MSFVTAAGLQYIMSFVTVAGCTIHHVFCDCCRLYNTSCLLWLLQALQYIISFVTVAGCTIHHVLCDCCRVYNTPCLLWLLQVVQYIMSLWLLQALQYIMSFVTVAGCTIHHVLCDRCRLYYTSCPCWLLQAEHLNILKVPTSSYHIQSSQWVISLYGVWLRFLDIWKCFIENRSSETVIISQNVGPHLWSQALQEFLAVHYFCNILRSILTIQHVLYNCCGPCPE